MAALATLHRDPPPPPRSPQRQALSEAVERYKAASVRVERLQKALATSRYDCTDRLREVGNAEAALADAREAAPKRLAASILGEAVPPGPSVAEAQSALVAAQTAYDELAGAVKIVDAEINDDVGGARAHASRAQSAVERALAAVIASDPALGELVAAFDAARAELAALSAVFKYLSLVRLPDHLQSWFAENRPLPPIEPRVPAWRDAIAALERGEADTLLPLV